MKIYNKTLKKAFRYLKGGSYGKLIALLEPKVPLFLENYHFYYFLGAACYHSGDVGGAETYLKRAIQVDRRSEEPRLFLAAVYLKKKDTTEAVRIWLGLLDLNPACKRAKKGLDAIRRISDQDVLNSFLDAGRFDRMLPKTRRSIPVSLYPVLGLLALLLGAYLTLSLWLPLIDGRGKPGRENLALLYKDLEKDEIADAALSDAYYILDEREITRTLRLAQSLFDEYKDNQARREINRLKYSNAGEGVKQKALLLEGYLRDPDMTTLSSAFGYKEVALDPRLYENCLVLWRGRFSNFRYSEEDIEFDFLVGYQDSQVLEGIVPVRIGFPVKLDPAFPLEMLGKVELLNDKDIRLQGVAVHNMIE